MRVVLTISNATWIYIPFTNSHTVTTHGETLLCRISQKVLDYIKFVFLYQTITSMKVYEGKTPK